MSTHSVVQAVPEPLGCLDLFELKAGIMFAPEC